MQSNAKGGKYLPIKGKDGCNNPAFHSTQWAAVAWEPSAFAAEGDRVNVCLEATKELAEAVLWETRGGARSAPRPCSAILGFGGEAGRGARQRQL